MQVVHFDPKIWEILLVLIIGLTLAGLVAKRPKLFWPLLIIVNILGIGPSLMKYFFWDKVLTGFIMMGALQHRSVDKGHLRNAVRRDDHKLMFGLWVGYMIMESVIGVIANSDPRISFWIIFYALLGLLSYILCCRGRDFPFPSIRQFSIIVLVTVSLYNIAYLAYGIIIENVLGIQYGRFAAQFLFRDTSFVWSGPSIAPYPTIIGMPAAIVAMNDGSFRVRMLVLVSVFFMMATAFYYDSRAAWIVIFCVLLVSLRKIRVSKIITIILIFLPAFYYFMGSMKTSDFFGEIASGTQILWSPSEKDVPRQKHTVAALLRVTDNMVTFFVGDGIYSHKLTIIPYMQKVYENVPAAPIVIQSQELRDDDFVRTNAFSALLIDTGVIGMMLLILLFIFTAYKVISQKGPHRAVLLTTLFLTFTWQFSINMTAITLFYLLFMPSGLVEQISKISAPIKSIRRGL